MKVKQNMMMVEQASSQEKLSTSVMFTESDDMFAANFDSTHLWAASSTKEDKQDPNLRDNWTDPEAYYGKYLYPS